MPEGEAEGEGGGGGEGGGEAPKPRPWRSRRTKGTQPLPTPQRLLSPPRPPSPQCHHLLSHRHQCQLLGLMVSIGGNLPLQSAWRAQRIWEVGLSGALTTQGNHRLVALDSSTAQKK
eukprot:3576756-Pyramimonas_sp.AAC.1